MVDMLWLCCSSDDDKQDILGPIWTKPVAKIGVVPHRQCFTGEKLDDPALKRPQQARIISDTNNGIWKRETKILR